MSALHQSDNFSAHLALPAGVAVSVTAPTLAVLQTVVARLQPANDAPVDAPDASTATKLEKGAPMIPTPAPTSAPVPAPVAVSGSASTDGEKHPTFDDVRDRVLRLAKVSRSTAADLLGKFGVDTASKLKLKQYSDFIAQADAVLAGAK